MKSWDLHSLNTRNKLMLMVCWGLVLTGMISLSVAFGVIYVYNVLAIGIVLFAVPTYLVWKKIYDRYIMYYIVVLFSLCGFLLSHFSELIGRTPSYEMFSVSFLFIVILSLYFDYRPVMLMGVANMLYTIYFVVRFQEELFSEQIMHHIIPLVSVHALVTTALVAQSIIGERLWKNSLKMEKLSKIDALTGLYNHKMFYEYLDQLLQERAQGSGSKLQLAVIDIDNFKSINDTYGHAVGDLIIKRVAETIQGWTTSDDIAVRYGGEEFVIIFLNKSMAETLGIVESIRKTLARYHHPEVDHKPVTVSIGLKEADGTISKSELFTQTDELLYKAKRSGKNLTMIE